MTAKPDLILCNEQSLFKIDEKLIKKIALAALAEVGISAPVSIVFTDNQKIADINKRFLNHDGPTDVISFPYEEPELVGEVIINVERALEMTDGEPDKTLNEIALYVVHGILHLGGFSDKTPQKAALMHQTEDRILEGFGIKVE